MKLKQMRNLSLHFELFRETFCHKICPVMIQILLMYLYLFHVYLSSLSVLWADLPEIKIRLID